MTQPIAAFNGQQVAGGIFPGQEEEVSALWDDCENIRFTQSKALSALGLDHQVGSLRVIEIAQAWADEDDDRAYYQDELFRIIKWEGAGQRVLGAIDRRATLVPYGRFLLVGARGNRIRIWRNGGSLETINQSPQSRVFVEDNSHVVAFGDGRDEFGPEYVRWSHVSDPETWNKGNGNNAGNIPIRQLKGEFNCARKIGNRILAYTPGMVVIFQYGGGNFKYREVHRMQGIGVSGVNCVVEAGYQHFGFNRQGIFRTDGNEFEYIEEIALARSIVTEVDWDDADGITGFHNKDDEEVQFHYTNEDGDRKGIGFNYRTGAFTRYRLPIYAAAPREVYIAPLIGTDEGLHFARGRTTYPIRLRSKALDCGNPAVYKFWESLRFVGQFHNMWIRVGLKLDAGVDVHWIYEGRVHQNVVFDPRQNSGFQEAPYLVFELYSEDHGWMELSQFQIWGEPNAPLG